MLAELRSDGMPVAEPRRVANLAATVRAYEERDRPRWVWPSTADIYPVLLSAGVRVRACHDLALVEGLLVGAAGRWGEPHGLAAAWARLHGEPVPPDPQPTGVVPVVQAVPDTLFAVARDTGLPTGVSEIDAAVAVHADQLARLRAGSPVAPLLVGAESACALVAAEMAAAGLPWRADVHDALLTRLLGPRARIGRPARLAELADAVVAAFGGRPVNPDSPAELLRAFARDGVALTTTRSWELREVEHPAVAPLLAYKELARLHSAHGWTWLSQWVTDGRFRGEYVVGGVVSGRWATRGGGALQIPRAVRAAVVADPGWSLVVADAAQLEPRVLAALADDQGLATLAGQGDLYRALAVDAFAGDRDRAKVAVLGTLYGQTSGEAGALLAVLRRRFPAAVGYVEAAARAGEEGRLVRSRLGRTCPPPGQSWRTAQDAASQPDAPVIAQRRAGQVARDRGRFTRNFVVQASAADWTAVLLAALRERLSSLVSVAGRPELVFFQHDEVMVHCPSSLAPAVTEAVAAAGEQARRLVFGDTPVRLPLTAVTVDRYADAK